MPSDPTFWLTVSSMLLGGAYSIYRLHRSAMDRIRDVEESVKVLGEKIEFEAHARRNADTPLSLQLGELREDLQRLRDEDVRGLLASNARVEALLETLLSDRGR